MEKGKLYIIQACIIEHEIWRRELPFLRRWNDIFNNSLLVNCH